MPCAPPVTSASFCVLIVSLLVLLSMDIPRRIGRNVPRREIAHHLFAGACLGRPVSAAARQAQAEPLTSRDMLAALGVQPRAVCQLHPPRRARMPAGAAARGVVDPVEHCVEVEIVSVPRLDLDHLSEPTAMGPRTPGPLAQVLAPHDDRTDLLGRL